MKKNLKTFIAALALTTFIGNSTLASASAAKQYGLNLNSETTVLGSRNRSSFKGYAGQGTLTIKGNGASNAEVYVNDKLVDVSAALKNGSGVVDISKYTVDGYNNVKVTEVSPANSKIEIAVSAPTVKDTRNTEEFSKSKLNYVDKFIRQETKGINPITGEDMIASGKVQAGFPGAVLTVVKDGEIVKSTAYGTKQLWNKNDLIPEAQREPMTENTMFDLASNSKMYSTNLALMKLVYEGKIDLDDKVQKYLPEYKDAPDAEFKGKSTITLRHLLHHCAGHKSSIRFYEESSGEFYSHDREKTISLLSKVPLTYEIGSKTVYSDTDYMILGYIVEQVTGMKQDKYVEENIYKPLGLKNTCYNPLEKGFTVDQFAATERNGNTRDGSRNYPDIRTETVRGEVHDEKAFYCMDGVSGHAGLFSTGKDLAVLTQLLLNGGTYGNVTLFDKATLDEFIKPSYYGADWGLGWNSQDGKRSRDWMFSPYTYNTIGHTGWTGTLTSIDFENNMAVILLTNERNSPCPKGKFEGELQFQTGRYGSPITLVYEALLENKSATSSKNEETLTKVLDTKSKNTFEFPRITSTARPLINNKVGFYGYEGRGYLLIQNSGVTNADVYVNGNKLNIGDLSSYNGDGKIFDIGAYTKNGVNALKVENIAPEKDAKLNISIVYPELVKSDKSLSRFSTIDSIINSEIKQGVSGASLGVINNGELIKESYYGTAIEDKLIPLGNGTEAFATALAIEKLISDGIVKYTDSASKYVEGINDSITIRNLLEHTSGLPEKITQTSASQEFASGSKVRYSEYDGYFLGKIVEKASGMTLDEYVESMIYKPLGLNNTMFNPTSKGIDSSKVEAGLNDYTSENLNGVSGISGLYSTIKDMSVLSQLILNYGGYGTDKIIDKNQIQYMISAVDENPQQALGFIRQGSYDNIESLGAYGSSRTIGFESNTGVSVAIDMESGCASVFTAMDKGSSFIVSRGGNVMSLVREALNAQGDDNYSSLLQMTKDAVSRANNDNSEDNRKAVVVLMEVVIEKLGAETAKPIIESMMDSTEKTYLLGLVNPKADLDTDNESKEDGKPTLPQTGSLVDTNMMIALGSIIAASGIVVDRKNRKKVN